MNSLKKRSLKTKVSLISILAILFFGFSIGIYTLHKEYQYRIEGVRSEILKSASFLVQQAHILLKQADEISLLNTNQVVHQNVKQKHFSYVEIVNAQGQLVIPYDPLGLEKPHNLAIQEGPWNSMSVGQNFIFHENEYPDVGRVIEGVFGIIERNQILGYVVLAVSKNPIEASLRKSMRTTVAWLGLLLLGVVLILWRLTRRAIQPVLDLAGAIETLKDHDPVDKLIVTGAREIEILSSAFRKYVSTNRDYEKKMQQTIEEKTRSLEESKEEMKAILDISGRLSKVMDLDRAAAELIETARQIVYCNAGYVFMAEQTVFTLYPKLYSKKSFDIVSQDVLRDVMIKGDMEVIVDTRYSNSAGKFSPHIRSCALFPIISPAARPLGVLVLVMTGEAKFEESKLTRLSGAMLSVGVIFENVMLYRESERLSRQDSMTGLLNRQAILQNMEKEFQIAERNGGSVSIILADLDHFKNINDTYGHLTGDKVIQSFVKIIRESRRAGESTGRFGGEEFLIVLPNTDLENASIVAEKILKDVRMMRVHTDKGDSLSFRVSMGVAEFPSNGMKIKEIIEKADQALYKAKMQGRDRYGIADESRENLLHRLSAGLDSS
jgi:diguanylate cyclase (GGDEF)-like protein